MMKAGWGDEESNRNHGVMSFSSPSSFFTFSQRTHVDLLHWNQNQRKPAMARLG